MQALTDEPEVMLQFELQCYCIYAPSKVLPCATRIGYECHRDQYLSTIKAIGVIITAAILIFVGPFVSSSGITTTKANTDGAFRS